LLFPVCAPPHATAAHPARTAGGGKNWMYEGLKRVGAHDLRWKSSPQLAGKKLLAYGAKLEESKVLSLAEVCSSFER
jgi:hypothetical protein